MYVVLPQRPVWPSSIVCARTEPRPGYDRPVRLRSSRRVKGARPSHNRLVADHARLRQTIRSNRFSLRRGGALLQRRVAAVRRELRRFDELMLPRAPASVERARALGAAERASIRIPYSDEASRKSAPALAYIRWSPR